MKALGVHILVVDDHKMVAELLASMVEGVNGVQRVAIALNAAEAVGIAQKQRIDIAFVDARMPGTDGLALMTALRKLRPHTKLVGMTSFDEDETIADLLQLEPDGILLKRSTGREEIRNCIVQILNGGTFYSSGVQLRLAQFPMLLKAAQHLTKRELEILQLICEGHSSKLIAHRLQLKEATIDDYRKEMLKKTSTKNVAELVSYAHRNGLV